MVGLWQTITRNKEHDEDDETENINMTERINLEIMLKHKFDTRNINRMEKQQHETGSIIRTDTINLEMMKKEQFNMKEMMMNHRTSIGQRC